MKTSNFLMPIFPLEMQQGVQFMNVSTPKLLLVLRFTKDQYTKEQVKQVIQTNPNKNDKRTIIREILDSDLPAADRSAFTLEQEASKLRSSRHINRLPRPRSNSLLHPLLSTNTFPSQIRAPNSQRQTKHAIVPPTGKITLYSSNNIRIPPSL